jgi:hypothetical protein
MGSIAVTAGSVRVKTCSEVGAILKDLGRLAEGMDERQVSGHRRGQGVMEIEIYISGHTSASHATAIDEKVKELGGYAVEAGRFRTEWECEQDHFFVGTNEQVAVAESADALEHIQSLAPKLRGDDITAVLNTIICDTQMPAYKKKYLEKSGSLCPFCESKDITSGPVQTDGPVGWADVECEGCGASWQDVWSLIDITEAKGKNGKEIEG